MIGLEHYLVVSVLLFTIGIYGLITRVNLIRILFSIEFIFNAVGIMVVAYSSYMGTVDGAVFALIIMAIAALEAAVGMAIIVLVYHTSGTIHIDKFIKRRW